MLLNNDYLYYTHNLKHRWRNGKERRKIEEKRKAAIVLLVDITSAHFGNSNDENTSRGFFEYPRISVRIIIVGIKGEKVQYNFRGFGKWTYS